MKKLIIAGNWKLYVTDSVRAKKIVATLKRKSAAYSGMELVLLPPAPLLSTVALVLGKSPIAVGAQAISALGDGPHTGYISTSVVKHAGASWVLVGHSEQRAREIAGIEAAAQSNDAVAHQVNAAHNAGLKVMLCVGEIERDPSGAHFNVIAEQLSSALAHVAKSNIKLVIAYEPVWAIGKMAAEAMKPAELEEVVIFIRRTLTELFDRTVANKTPILYGGSVDGTNAKDLLEQGGVSGFLVGRASTDAESFLEIIQSCKK